MNSTIFTKNHLSSNNPEILMEIQNKGINLTIWNRKLEENTTSYIKNLLTIPRFAIHLPYLKKDEWRNMLPSFPKIDSFSFLFDLINLGEIFKNITGISPVIQLSTIETMQCPLFHVDYISYRMICTYSGEGTLWVQNSNLNREYLGYGKNENLILDKSKIEQLGPFAVMMMKGEKNLIDPGNGLVHKSPEVISGKRLFLRIDAI